MDTISVISYNQIQDNNELVRFARDRTEGQAKYLLYNFFWKHSYNNNPDDQHQQQQLTLELPNSGHDITNEELEEVIGYLKTDFNIVGQTSNMEDFIRQSMELTGWGNKKFYDDMPKSTTKTTIHENISKKRVYLPAYEQVMDESVEQDLLFWERMFGSTTSGTTSEI